MLYELCNVLLLIKITYLFIIEFRLSNREFNVWVTKPRHNDLHFFLSSGSESQTVDETLGGPGL